MADTFGSMDYPPYQLQNSMSFTGNGLQNLDFMSVTSGVDQYSTYDSVYDRYVPHLDSEDSLLTAA
jgi:hypothetical protein